jgi:hypothetical protein
LGREGEGAVSNRHLGSLLLTSAAPRCYHRPGRCAFGEPARRRDGQGLFRSQAPGGIASVSCPDSPTKCGDSWRERASPISGSSRSQKRGRTASPVARRSTSLRGVVAQPPYTSTRIATTRSWRGRPPLTDGARGSRPVKHLLDTQRQDEGEPAPARGSRAFGRPEEATLPRCVRRPASSTRGRRLPENRHESLNLCDRPQRPAQNESARRLW